MITNAHSQGVYRNYSYVRLVIAARIGLGNRMSPFLLVYGKRTEARIRNQAASEALSEEGDLKRMRWQSQRLRQPPRRPISQRQPQRIVLVEQEAARFRTLAFCQTRVSYSILVEVSQSARAVLRRELPELACTALREANRTWPGSKRQKRDLPYRLQR
jgi:hypothetical protein